MVTLNCCVSLLQKTQDTAPQETSTLWKGHLHSKNSNRIWFQTRDDVMMEADRIWFVKYKSRNWNPAMPDTNITNVYNNTNNRSPHWRQNQNYVTVLWYAIDVTSFTWKWITDLDAFIKYWGSFNQLLLCKHAYFLAPPFSLSIMIVRDRLPR